MLLFLIFFCVSVWLDKSMILHASVSFTLVLFPSSLFLATDISRVTGLFFNRVMKCYSCIFQFLSYISLVMHILNWTPHHLPLFSLNWFMMFVAVEGSLRSVKRRETKTSSSRCRNLNVLLWEKSRLWRKWHKIKFICFSSLIWSSVKRWTSFSRFTSWFLLKKKKPRDTD